VAARGAAQQREQMRRIGVLMNLGSEDAEALFNGMPGRISRTSRWSFWPSCRKRAQRGDKEPISVTLTGQ
jgi:hypothetical protein